MLFEESEDRGGPSLPILCWHKHAINMIFVLCSPKSNFCQKALVELESNFRTLIARNCPATEELLIVLTIIMLLTI
jgi:hypothetical protein